MSASLLTGWSTLSRRFTTELEPAPDARSAGPLFYSIYMRYWGHYGGVVRVSVDRDALYMAPMFLFRIGHPNLRIPWHEIQIGEAKFLGRKFIVLTLGSEEQIPLRIRPRMAAKLGIAVAQTAVI